LVRRIFARLPENEILGEIGQLPLNLELSLNQAGEVIQTECEADGGVSGRKPIDLSRNEQSQYAKPSCCDAHNHADLANPIDLGILGIHPHIPSKGD